MLGGRARRSAGAARPAGCGEPRAPAGPPWAEAPPLLRAWLGAARPAWSGTGEPGSRGAGAARAQQVIGSAAPGPQSRRRAAMGGAVPARPGQGPEGQRPRRGLGAFQGRGFVRHSQNYRVISVGKHL